MACASRSRRAASNGGRASSARVWAWPAARAASSRSPSATGSASSPTISGWTAVASSPTTIISATRRPPTTARRSRALVLTNDNAGDGLCASVSTGRGTALVRHEAVPSAPGSLGSFYSFVTLLLGMKFGEHEYKVMGLAPYAPAGQAERAFEALSAVFGLESTTPARFAWKRRGQRYRLLLETTLGLRFDAVAAGAQRIVEDSLLAWARLMRERHGGDRLALGGGVFMNVKANGLIADEPWVRDL